MNIYTTSYFQVTSGVELERMIYLSAKCPIVIKNSLGICWVIIRHVEPYHKSDFELGAYFWISKTVNAWLLIHVVFCRFRRPVCEYDKSISVLNKFIFCLSDDKVTNGSTSICGTISSLCANIAGINTIIGLNEGTIAYYSFNGRCKERISDKLFSATSG